MWELIFTWSFSIPERIDWWLSSLVAQIVKNLPAMRTPGFCPWVGKIPQRRAWQPTPVLLPGKSHGRRSLIGCSPWGHEELDMTEQLHFHFSLSCIGEGNGKPTPVFLPGESQGQRSLAGCSLWGHKQLEYYWARTHTHTHLSICIVKCDQQTPERTRLLFSKNSYSVSLTEDP